MTEQNVRDEISSATDNPTGLTRNELRVVLCKVTAVELFQEEQYMDSLADLSKEGLALLEELDGCSDIALAVRLAQSDNVILGVAEVSVEHYSLCTFLHVSTTLPLKVLSGLWKRAKKDAEGLVGINPEFETLLN